MAATTTLCTVIQFPKASATRFKVFPSTYKISGETGTQYYQHQAKHLKMVDPGKQLAGDDKLVTWEPGLEPGTSK